MSDVSLDTFPSTKTEALTLLYLQQQNWEDKKPEELANAYEETFHKIKKQLILLRNINYK